MNFVKKNKILIIVVCALIIMILGVFFWNYISKKQSEDKNKLDNNSVDVSDVNNIDSVEAKLGEDVKITQGYLLNYTTKKSGIWYMSSGAVKNIIEDNKYSTITISSDDGKVIKGTIATDKCDVKKEDFIYFVGTIDLKTMMLNLTKVDIEQINYKNVEEIELNDLVDNINLIKENYFIVHGYLVTDGDQYKLYDTKDAYKENEGFGSYFTLSWKEEFPYTGTKEVSVKCKIDDTYKLNECELID